MKQIELADRLGVSKAYVSMVLSGKRKPSKKLSTRLKMMGIEVNSQVNFEVKTPILSHARLPVPTLPPQITWWLSLSQGPAWVTICPAPHRSSGPQ